jgi:hypothetical protein
LFDIFNLNESLELNYGEDDSFKRVNQMIDNAKLSNEAYMSLLVKDDGPSDVELVDLGTFIQKSNFKKYDSNIKYYNGNLIFFSLLNLKILYDIHLIFGLLNNESTKSK